MALMIVTSDTTVASVYVGSGRPAARYAWFRAARSSLRWAAFARVIPGMSAGSVHSKPTHPKAIRSLSIAERNSVKWTARTGVLGPKGSSVNPKASVTVRVVVAVLPTASLAVTVSTFDPGWRTMPLAIHAPGPTTLAVPSPPRLLVHAI